MFHRSINHLSFQYKIKLSLNFHIFKYIIKTIWKSEKHLFWNLNMKKLQIKLVIINFWDVTKFVFLNVYYLCIFCYPSTKFYEIYDILINNLFDFLLYDFDICLWIELLYTYLSCILFSLDWWDVYLVYFAICLLQ